MLGVARGLALVITNGLPIYGLPDPIVFLGQGRPFGVPTPVIILLLTALVAHVLLAHTRFGLYAQVIGDNEAAARAMGFASTGTRSISTCFQAGSRGWPACCSPHA